MHKYTTFVCTRQIRKRSIFFSNTTPELWYGETDQVTIMFPLIAPFFLFYCKSRNMHRKIVFLFCCSCCDIDVKEHYCWILDSTNELVPVHKNICGTWALLVHFNYAPQIEKIIIKCFKISKRALATRHSSSWEMYFN